MNEFTHELIRVKDLIRTTGCKERLLRKAIEVTGVCKIVELQDETGKNVEYISKRDADIALGLIQARKTAARNLKANTARQIGVLIGLLKKRIEIEFDDDVAKEIRGAIETLERLRDMK